MFNWSINLSDKQVIMLMGFHTSQADKWGDQFSAIRDLIGDAWDIRAARKLVEDGLITHETISPPPKDYKPGYTAMSRWAITDKGRLIALAIIEDTEMLQKMHLRAVGPSLKQVAKEGHSHWLEKKDAKRKNAA